MRSLFAQCIRLLFVSAALQVSGVADFETPSTPRIDQLTDALVQAPDSPRLLGDRGHAYALLGLKKLALADLQRAVELAPNNNSVLSRAGWSYFNLKEHARALDLWWQAAASSNYAFSYDFYTVALGYWAMGDGVKAAAFYDRAVELEEAFGEWATLVPRTESWTWAEKDMLYRLFDAWRRGYRLRPEK